MTEAQAAACVLYEDNHLLVVCKPPNVPVQADASGDEDLLTALKAYLKRKYGKPGEVYLGLVHRLDRPVGGAMVFARTSKAAARLTDQVRTRQMGRTYLAVVRGDPPGSGALRDFLLKDERTNTSRAVPEGTPGAKEARLTYRVLARREGLALCEIHLQTGRSHQIRVQFSHGGWPLWGDARYGGGRPGEQIALWGCALDLVHPTKKEAMHFSCPPPEVLPFSRFPEARRAGTEGAPGSFQ